MKTEFDRYRNDFPDLTSNIDNVEGHMPQSERQTEEWVIFQLEQR